MEAMKTLITLLLTVLHISFTIDVSDNLANFRNALPVKMEALDGTCFYIPCKFTYKGDQRPKSVCGKWTHANSTKVSMVYDSCQESNVGPLVLTGRLDQGDCTAVLYDVTPEYAQYYFFTIDFTIEKEFQFMLSANVHIKVAEHPPNTTITLPSGPLKENESITVTCYAYTPCPESPPQLKWHHSDDNQQRVEQLPDGTFTTKLEDTLTLTAEHHGYNLECSAVYNLKRHSQQTRSSVTLSVLFDPRDTVASISPSGPVPFGTLVTMRCSSRANPPSNFTWFMTDKNNTLIIVSWGEVWHLEVTQQGDFYCLASNSLGQQTSTMLRVAITGQPFESLADQPEKSFIQLIFAGVCAFLVILLILGLFLAWWFRGFFSNTFFAWLCPAQKEVLDDLTLVAYRNDGIHFDGSNTSVNTPANHAQVQQSAEPHATVCAI
ncbi:myelin-associated glycoprotein-like [Dunckerocampus dactyliophorus]|uniref:myelin-associated glycoprotein-like n=1 Tax=Dunckerocampus dactyliophorus TaxID=161453 RepID=UPI002404F220|nr:myelin-associated glycoprotein-like [Dunckerocampus dactyliophorus]